MEVGTYAFNDDPPGIWGFSVLKSIVLTISDPYLLEELYITKNKYFDKHPRVGYLYEPCLGESILFSRSSELWSKKRKSMSAAFYKDKLHKMMDIVKDVAIEFLDKLDREFIKPKKPFNLAQKINDL